MFIASFVAGPWQTNCYVLAADGATECLVVDPGVQAAETAVAALAERGLECVGIVATHGHLDHVYDAHTLARRWGVPVWLHEADQHLLTDPLAGIGPMGRDVLLRLRGTTTLPEPADVRPLAGGEVLSLAGVDLRLTHAPGHTQGCVLLEADVTGVEGADRVVLTGDVVFAGSIGRTDLPGADHGQMLASLRAAVLPIADTAVLLPGHGPSTTMARERATNPYLKGL